MGGFSREIVGLLLLGAGGRLLGVRVPRLGESGQDGLAQSAGADDRRYCRTAMMDLLLVILGRYLHLVYISNTSMDCRYFAAISSGIHPGVHHSGSTISTVNGLESFTVTYDHSGSMLAMISLHRVFSQGLLGRSLWPPELWWCSWLPHSTYR